MEHNWRQFSDNQKSIVFAASTKKLVEDTNPKRSKNPQEKPILSLEEILEYSEIDESAIIKILSCSFDTHLSNYLFELSIIKNQKYFKEFSDSINEWYNSEMSSNPAKKKMTKIKEQLSQIKENYYGKVISFFIEELTKVNPDLFRNIWTNATALLCTDNSPNKSLLADFFRNFFALSQIICNLTHLGNFANPLDELDEMLSKHIHEIFINEIKKDEIRYFKILINNITDILNNEFAEESFKQLETKFLSQISKELCLCGAEYILKSVLSQKKSPNIESFEKILGKKIKNSKKVSQSQIAEILEKYNVIFWSDLTKTPKIRSESSNKLDSSLDCSKDDSSTCTSFEILNKTEEEPHTKDTKEIQSNSTKNSIKNLTKFTQNKKINKAKQVDYSKLDARIFEQLVKCQIKSSFAILKNYNAVSFNLGDALNNLKENGFNDHGLYIENGKLCSKLPRGCSLPLTPEDIKTFISIVDTYRQYICINKSTIEDAETNIMLNENQRILFSLRSKIVCAYVKCLTIDFDKKNPYLDGLNDEYIYEYIQSFDLPYEMWLKKTTNGWHLHILGDFSVWQCIWLMLAMKCDKDYIGSFLHNSMLCQLCKKYLDKKYFSVRVSPKVINKNNKNPKEESYKDVEELLESGPSKHLKTYNNVNKEVEEILKEQSYYNLLYKIQLLATKNSKIYEKYLDLITIHLLGVFNHATLQSIAYFHGYKNCNNNTNTIETFLYNLIENLKIEKDNLIYDILKKIQQTH